MNTLTKEDLQELSNYHDSWCVSIFLPTFDKSQETRQNPIRFKNLLDEAASQLKIIGMDNAEIEAFIKPARSLLREETFWQQQQQGLAVLFTDGVFRTIQLPMPVEELAVVNHRFHLKPLLPLMYGEGEFYILALSQNEARLIKATQHSAEEIKVPGMPKNMDEALDLDTDEDSLSFYRMSGPSTGGPAGGEAGSNYYGYSRGDEDKKKRLFRYFNLVDNALVKHLRDSQSPLMIAGVEYIEPIFKEATEYQHLVDGIITGNQEDASPEHLRDLAWPMVRPLFETTREEIVGRYKQLSGWNDERAVKDLKEVIKAAPFGRVEVLFVDKNAKKWGTFDANNVEVNFEDESHPENQDLLDFAAIQTILNGGTVYAVDPEELPEEGSPVAAIFRY